MSEILRVVGIKVDPKPAKKGSEEVKKSLTGVRKSADKVKASLVAAFSGVAIGAAVRQFAEYDQALRNVATVAGATQREFEQLNDTALDLALGTRFNPQEVAQGMYSLASAGQSVNQQIKTLPNVLNLAEAAQADLGRTTELVVSSMAQFGIEAADSQRVVDTFTASIANSATNVPRLQVAMANSGSTANAMNQEFESSVAVLSILTTAFGNGEKAGTGYKTLLNQLATNGEKLGLSVKDTAGNMLPLVDILDDIKAAGIPATDLMKTFGTEAGPALAVLLDQGTDAIDKMRDSLLSNGQASETAAKQLDTLQGDWDQLISTLSVALIQSVETTEPILRELIQSVTATIQFLMETASTVSNVVKSVFGGGEREFSVFGKTLEQIRGETDALVESMKNVSLEQMKNELKESQQELLTLTEEYHSMKLDFEDGGIFLIPDEAAQTGLDRRATALEALKERTAALREEVRAAVEVEEQAKETTDALTDSTEGAAASMALMLENTSAQTAQLSEMNEAQQLFNNLIADAETRTNKYFKIESRLEKQRKSLKKLLDAGKISLDQYGKAMGEAAKQFNKSASEIDGLEKDVKSLNETIDDVDFSNMFDGFAAGLNPVLGGLQSFKDELAQISEFSQDENFAGSEAFFKTGIAAEFALNSIAGMAQEGSDAQRKLQAAAAITNTILGIKAVLTQGEGDPYTAFGRMAAMAALVGSLGVQINGAFGGGGAGGAEARQARQGTGTVLGEAGAKSESVKNALDLIASATDKIVGINSKMLRSLNRMNDAISGTANQIARTGGIGELGTQSGGFGGIQLTPVDGFLQSLIFGKSKITDRGIEILSGSIQDAISGDIFQAYEIAKRKGLFGSSSRTNTADLDEGVTNQISLIFGSMLDAVLSGAEALGLNMTDVQAAIDAFQIEEQRISLMDLSAEDQQAELEAVFSSIFDNLAGTSIPFLAQFQQAGEGLGETLARVSTTVLVFEEAVESMGLDFIAKQVDPERFAQAAVSIAEFAGGMDQFIDGYSTFISKFLSESEQMDIMTDRLTGVFAGLGLELPETREGFKDLIRGLDLTTAAGQEAFGTLIGLSGEMDSFYSGLDALKENSLQGAMDALMGITDELAQSNVSLYDQLVRNNEEIQNAILMNQIATDSEQQIIDGLRSRYEMELAFIDQIRSASESVQSMLSSTRESIELSLMDDESQYEYFRAQAESIADQIQFMTDPQAIQDAISQINDYTNRAYGLLDDSQREALAPEFLQFLDDTGLLADTRLGTLEDETVQQTEQILNRIEQMQEANAEAEAQNQAAFATNVQIMRESVEMMNQVVTQMGQIRFPVDVIYRDDYDVSNL